jgi:hypothetical protein
MKRLVDIKRLLNLATKLRNLDQLDILRVCLRFRNSHFRHRRQPIFERGSKVVVLQVILVLSDDEFFHPTAGWREEA